MNPYLGLALAILVSGCTWEVHTWYDDHKTVKVIQQQEKVIAKANTATFKTDTATQTKDTTIHGNGAAIQKRIDTNPLTGAPHVTTATGSCTLPADPFQSPDFRVLYDAAADPAGHPG